MWSMSTKFFAPGRDNADYRHLPGIDDRLAPPETRLEYIDGIEYFAAPADPPHGNLHAQIAMVVRSTARSDHETAVDLLTRTDEASDLAPDVSVYPKEMDPSGRRKIDELSFEIASEQSISVPTKKARALIGRGARRVFCVLVKQSRVLEWSREADTWQTLPETGVIDDPVLVRPLPVRALLDAAAADRATVEAMIVKDHPALHASQAAARAEGRIEGTIEGKVEGKIEGWRSLDSVDTCYAAFATANSVSTWAGDL
jgi:hypothetical protein